MRVCFISHVSNKYGAGRSLLSFIDGLLQKGVQCYVIMPNKGPMMEDLKNRGIKYHIVPIKNWTSKDSRVWKRILRSCFNLIVSLVIAVRSYTWRADVLYTNSSVISVGAFAAFILRKPHIWHVREFGQEHYGFSFDLGKQLSMKLIDRLSFRVIVISEALRQKYLQYISPQKLKLIYNPVYVVSKIFNNLKAEHGLRELRIPSLVFVGVLHPGKGQIDAVLAVAELVKQGIQVKLRLVGKEDREYLKYLKKAIVQNSIEEYVEFTGHVDEPARIMNSADIILVCSQWEAFGRVTVEAMLAGKPVIGARSGATPELIKEGFNGLLYEPINYKDLATKIKYLIDHPEKAKQMGTNGFEWASKQFTVEKCASQMFDIIQEAIQPKNR